MKIMKKPLAMLLVLFMLISMVPLNSFAASNNAGDGTTVTATEGSENDFVKVFHLDCGRKYFTVDQIKELIDSLSNVGFSHMELAIGNDGLRLLLDDMSISANGTTYSSETVKEGIKAGNASYSHSGEWSQDDMDTIISYAATKGIEIIPLVNNPGHMDSILAAMKKCGIDGYYESSARTVDLENAEAVAFTQALVMKYANYFAGKGCKYFNIGADEYANDYHTSDSTGMGFGYLIDNNKYGNFIKYINTLVENICDLGMTPIAFNDGIYFRENTSFGSFDNRLMIASWSGGWGGIKPASTTFLASKGHKILNTNERWYYVLGRSQSVNSTYCYERALSNAKSESVTTVTDHKDVTPIGAMQCVWCDDPSVDYGSYKSNVMTLINTFAENNPTYFTGPNEPLTPESVTMTDEDTGISVTAPGLTGLTVTKSTVPSVEGAIADKVMAWNITPVTDNGNYEGEAIVSIPVPSDWINVRGGVFASEHGPEVMGIKGKLENSIFTFTVPHFSNVVAYELDPAAIEYDEEIELTIGGTHQFVIEGSDLSSNTYSPSPAGVAKVEVSYEKVEGETTVTLGNQITPTNSSGWSDTGVIKSGNYYLVMSSNGTLSATTNVEEATVFTVARSSSNRWTIKSGSYYLRYSTYSGVSGSTTTYEWRNNSGFCRSSSSNYLTYSSGWKTEYSTNNRTYLYDTTTSTTAPVDESTITFTGVAAGETYITIGDITYKIVVSKKTESVTLATGDVKTYIDNSTSAPVVADPSVVDAVIADGKLTITSKAIGTTTVTTDNAIYTINVVEFDPSTVTPLTVEYWITNITTRTKESTNESPVIAQQISAAANDVATAEGADINKMMPEGTIKKDGDSGADREVEFWHVRLLDKTQTNDSTSGTEEQTTAAADDETTNGDAVTRVRYYDPDSTGRRWQLLSGTTWMDVDADNNQVVAYYMEKIDIQNANSTTELHVNAADWGKIGDGSPASSYADTSKYCSISLQIVYEDGSGNPATTTAEDLDSKTILYNYWDNGRGIGTFAFDTLGQFNIYQVTAETGAVTAEFSGGAWGTAQVTNFTWDNNEKVVWSGESETASVYNNTSHPTSEDPKDNLMWDENREAILLRVYVKAVETEDSLNVVYFDEKFNDTLYSYNLQVEKNHNFNSNMVGNPKTLENGRVDVTGCGIVNAYGQTQSFQTDLTKVPEAKGKYNSELYKYTGSEISEDGKTLYLYYNIDTSVLSPMFVADYGRPFTFSLSQVVGAGQETLVENVTVEKNTRYGILDYNADTKKFTYTPTQVLPNIDVLTINIKFRTESTVSTTNAGVMPATTVDYEEGFANLTGFTAGSKGDTMQNAWVAGTNPTGDVYGYDNKVITESNSYATSTTKGDTAEFAFTGTGVDMYVNSKAASGNVAIQVRNAENRLVKVISVKTTSNSTITDAFKNTEQKELIAASVTGLSYGQYSVKITTTDPADGVYFDGFRVYGTIQNQANEYYKGDLEDNPTYLELRDYVLTSVNVSNSDSKEVYAQIREATDETLTSAVLSNNVTYDGAALLENGPKNELFLLPGQSVVFKLNTAREVQVGMKAVNGTAKVTGSYTGTITSERDMFYTVLPKSDEAKVQTVTITNDGESTSILSISKVKICDDPNATFGELEADDLIPALGTLGYKTESEEPTPETPVDPEPGTPETPVVPEEPGTPDEPTQEPEHECTMTEEITPATTMKAGKIVIKCKECGEVESTKIIYKASNVKLGQATFVYNGKQKNPKVIVKDSKGNVINAKYYKVTKPTGRTNVGKYTYTIKFNGRYQGTKKLTLTVKPKASAIKTVTPSKKAFTVKWNKVSKQATGYEIMYATNAKFSKGKHTVTVKNFKTTSKKICNLKAKQKYYVKVRTYKTVKVNGKMTKIYSNWSKYKTVTTKR